MDPGKNVGINTETDEIFEGLRKEDFHANITTIAKYAPRTTSPFTTPMVRSCLSSTRKSFKSKRHKKYGKHYCKMVRAT